MKLFKRYSLLLILTLLFLIPLNGTTWGALTGQVSVEEGQGLISGQTFPNTDLSILVTRQESGQRCYIGQVKSDADGGFSLTIPLDAGCYSAYLGSKENSLTTPAFTIVDPKDTPGNGTTPGGNGGSLPQARTEVWLSISGDGRVILPRTCTSYLEASGKTVLDVVQEVLQKAGITYEIQSNGYVAAIAGLREKDRGPLSGWLFKVNGVLPPVGTSALQVKNGDFIEFVYTYDGSQEVLGSPGFKEESEEPETTQPFDTEQEGDEAGLSKEKEANLLEDFSDLAGYEWAVDAIKRLAMEGIIIGTPFGFEPGRAITRAEFCALLLAAGDPETKSNNPIIQFRDVPDSAWFSDIVARTVLTGITQGYPDHTFRPSQPITRFEAALMLYNMAGQPSVQAVLSFIDVAKIPAWTLPAIGFATNNRILCGFPDQSLRGRLPVTRAQAAVLVDRFIDWRINNE